MSSNGHMNTFKALADPTRRSILRVLTAGPLAAGQIGQALSIAPSALSFHLRVLKEADLIFDRREGQFIHYGLNTSVVEDVARFLLEQFGVGAMSGPPSPPNATTRSEDVP